MTPAAILALIATGITSNGVGAITGPVLANILNQIVGLFTTAANVPQVVSASTTITMSLTIFRYGLLRTLNLSAMTINLPPVAAVNIGQEWVVQDLSSNLSQYPATIVPPAGMTIAGRANYVMNEDNQTSRFYFYGQNLWGVEPA